MGFETGLSGLNANSQYLDSIGNNVSNSNVVGFKESQLSFSDIYANSLAGASSGNQIGLGTQVAAVAQQFAQGSITATDNPLDMAINGNGFFQLSSSATSGSLSYTRNGQFHVDKNGYLTNASGQFLMGYGLPSSSTGGVSSVSQLARSTTTTLQLPTSGVTGKASDTAELQANLNADATVPTVTTFDPTNASSYNDVASINIYDSQGNSHTLSLYFAKSSASTNDWNIYYTMDGSTTPVSAGTGGSVPSAISFDATGVLSSPTSKSLSLNLDVSSSVGVANTSQALSIDISKLTQFGGQAFGVTSSTSDGYSAGVLNGYSIGSDGEIQGTYSNGQKLILGQVTLSTFPSPDGLTPIGNNQWAESVASGSALPNAPGSGGAGELQSSAVEESNVDLTKELVNMIVAQRAYQANAQTIKTEDQILSTLVNLQ